MAEFNTYSNYNESIMQGASAVAIDEPTPLDPPVSIDVQSSDIPVPENTAAGRAAKADFGLSDHIPTLTLADYYDQIKNGQENALRTQVASQMDYVKNLSLQNSITQAANRDEATPLAIEDIDAIKKQWPVEYSGSSVFEDEFAKKFINNIYTTAYGKDIGDPKFNWLPDAIKQAPKEVQDSFTVGTGIIAKQQFVLRNLQDSMDRYQQQSYPSWTWDQIKGFFQAYTESQLRGNVEGVNWWDGMLGTNLQKQADALFLLPYGEFKRQLPIILEGLNPSLQIKFLTALYGQSSSDRQIDNAFTLMGLADVVGAAKGVISLGKKALGAYGRDAVGTAVRNAHATAPQYPIVPDPAEVAASVKVGTTTVEINGKKATAVATPQVDTTSPIYRAFVDDGLREVYQAEPVPVRVAAADAAGDVGEAAIQGTLPRVVQDVTGPSGELERQAKKALTTNYQADVAAERSNPTRFGQDLSNRIEAMIFGVVDKLTDVLENGFRVNRTPRLMQDEARVRFLKEEVAKNARGIDNHVLDVKGPFYLPHTNTYYFEVPMGTASGELFGDADVALNNARLNGYIVKPLPAQIDNLKNVLNSLKDQVKAGNATDEAGSVWIERLEKRVADLEENLRLVDEAQTGYDLIPHGNGFYYNLIAHVPEKGDIVRDGLISKIPLNSTKAYRNALKKGSDSTELPPSWFGGWLNAIIGYGRTPGETMSIAENAQRVIATHGPSVLLEYAKGLGSEIQAMPRKYWKDFDRLLKAGQRMPDPDNGGIAGYFFKNSMEVQDWYLRNIKDKDGMPRMPSKGELQAYAAYKAIMETDRAFREMSVFRNKAVLGGKSLRVYALDVNSARVYSPFFDVVQRNEFPGGRNNTILIMNPQYGKERLLQSDKPGGGKELETWKQKVESGMAKVFEIIDPDAQPLSGFGKVGDNHRVRYIVTNTSEERPLQFNQVPRRGGGHLQPAYSFYLKQARMIIDPTGEGVSHYVGDNTLMPIMNRALGQEISNHINQVAALWRADRKAEAKDYARTFLPWDWETHKGWYSPSKTPDGKSVKALLSWDEDVHVVPDGKLINDIDTRLSTKYSNFNDGTKSGSLLRSSMVEFTGERDVRDLMTVTRKGSVHNPIYSYEPAEYVDPLTSMDRGLSRIINSVFMDDYKQFAVEHWLAAAAPYLEVKGDLEGIRSAPYHHFLNYQFKKAAPEKLKLQLITNHQKITSFIGTPSKIDTALFSMTHDLADQIYNKTGKALDKVPIVPDWMLPYVRSPISFLRSAAYHTTMGMFAINQLWTQAMTATNVYAISPKHMATATMGAYFYMLSRFNKDAGILAHLDAQAASHRMPKNFGMSYFKPGQLTEMINLLDGSGFAFIGKEHALLDTRTPNKVVRNKLGTFLDWGEYPFKIGSGYTRISAFVTAYMEHRTEFPTGALTRGDNEKILLRASLLDHNMSRAYSSTLHTGIMSVPMQFGAYTLRLGEMMTGKRLTPMEKARLFGVSSVLYGVPAGGLGLYFFPIGDYLREKAEASGFYNVGADAIKSLFFDGLQALVHATITGVGDPQKGTWLNYSKFGTKGVDQLVNLFNSDKSIMEQAGGVVYSKLANTFENSTGFYRSVGAFLSGDYSSHPMKVVDIMDMFREIKIVNDTWSVLAAINSERWESKNGTYLADTSIANAMYMGLTGLRPTDVSDLYSNTKAIKNREEYQNWIGKQFLKEFRRFVEADRDNDPEQAKDYLNRAFNWADRFGGLSIQQKSSLMSRAMSEDKPVTANIKWQLYMKDVPQGMEEQLYGAYLEYLQSGGK